MLYVPTHTARELKKDLKAAGVEEYIPGIGKADSSSAGPFGKMPWRRSLPLHAWLYTP